MIKCDLRASVVCERQCFAVQSGEYMSTRGHLVPLHLWRCMTPATCTYARSALSLTHAIIILFVEIILFLNNR